MADRTHALRSALAAGIDRATRLVEQLLALARQEACAASGTPPKPVPLAGLARPGRGRCHAGRAELGHRLGPGDR